MPLHLICGDIHARTRVCIRECKQEMIHTQMHTRTRVPRVARTEAYAYTGEQTYMCTLLHTCRHLSASLCTDRTPYWGSLCKEQIFL